MSLSENEKMGQDLEKDTTPSCSDIIYGDSYVAADI